MNTVYPLGISLYVPCSPTCLSLNPTQSYFPGHQSRVRQTYSRDLLIGISLFVSIPNQDVLCAVLARCHQNYLTKATHEPKRLRCACGIYYAWRTPFISVAFALPSVTDKRNLKAFSLQQPVQPCHLHLLLTDHKSYKYSQSFPSGV